PSFHASTSSFTSLVIIGRRTSGRSSPLPGSSLSGDPLANIWSAGFQLGAGGFTPCQEPHRILIDEIDFLEIQCETTLPIFIFDQPLEAREMLALDAANEP